MSRRAPIAPCCGMLLSTSTAAKARRLMINGLVMSTAFAGLEGCVIASINLSAALMQPALASDVNAMLFASFSAGTLISPIIVKHSGLKPSLVASMAVYSLYLLALMGCERSVLLVSATVGGIAGSVLWTAQGVYFTRNAVAYAAAVDPTVEGESRAISAFAGILCAAQTRDATSFSVLRKPPALLA